MKAFPTHGIGLVRGTIACEGSASDWHPNLTDRQTDREGGREGGRKRDRFIIISSAVRGPLSDPARCEEAKRVTECQRSALRCVVAPVTTWLPWLQVLRLLQ